MKNKLYDVEEINHFRDILKLYKEKYSNKVAFKFKKNVKDNTPIEITYKEFANEIESLGTALLDLNLQNKKVAIISPNRYEWCVSYLAITNSNIMVVPLDKSLPDNEIEGLILRSKAECVIFDEKYLEVFKKIKDEQNSNINYFICMDFEKDENGIYSYRKLVEKGKNLLENKDKKFENIKIDKDKEAIMLFTSGTTSISKAVMLSQYNICSNINAIKSIIKIYEKDVLLSFLPLHHTFESTTTFLTGTSCGVTIAFCDGLKYIAKNLVEYEITGFVCVPLMLEAMYKKIVKGIEEQNKTKVIKTMAKISNFLLKLHIDIRKILFKPIINKVGGHLRLIVSGAASINKETIQGFNTLGINLIQGYGLTETSPVVSAESDKYKRVGSTGFPMYNVEVKIEDKDENGIGEIAVKGPSVMSRYYENEEATKEVLKDGWFYTGDLGYIDKDGFVYVKGRKKTVIVLKNGKNIYPEEIESLINKLDFVQESMVYEKKGLNDSDLACKIVYDKENIKNICDKEDANSIREAIWEEIKKINKQMPPYKYIRDIIITNEPLIKTTTQKIKRHEEMKKILNKSI